MGRAYEISCNFWIVWFNLISSRMAFICKAYIEKMRAGNPYHRVLMAGLVPIGL